VIDLSAHLGDTVRLVRRLLPENVAIETRLRPRLPLVRVDRGQIDQVLVSLCVNARDAMPGGGRLTVETSEVEVDGVASPLHGDLAPGRYVRLSVSDTGSGMDAAVQARIFEPFFTTKEKGKGTGLGLATVYGAVRQHGGAVTVYSEPGRGSAFHVYLPAETAELPATLAGTSPPPRAGAAETVLLVEDDPQVRAVAVRMLQGLGYAVLAASGAEEALAVEAAHGAPIHILVTDVIMPGLNGRQLAERLVARRGELRVLYTSGFTDDIIEHQGVLAANVHLLAKPFTVEQLAIRVRETLIGHSYLGASSS